MVVIKANREEEKIEDNYFEALSSEQEDRYLDVNAPYKISYYGADFTLSVLYEKMQSDEIIIPNFQRGYVWDKRRASRLIESFLLSIPVPPVFVFREPETQKLLIVDGNQRLTTIRLFFNGKFVGGREFSLTGVQSRWAGKVYSTLTRQDQIRLRDSILRTIIFQQNDPKDNSSMYQIFERLNTETSPLRDQEIRNALYRGPFNDLLKFLNEYGAWRELIGTAKPLPRMRDVEMILRFFALFYNLKSYTKPMKQFLNDFMKENKNLAVRSKATYESLFKETIRILHQGLGSSAFKITTGINVALFDALSVGVAKTKPSPEILKKSKMLLLKNKYFMDALEKHTTDKDKINKRIDLSTKVLSSK